jgi:diadenylate cyclase
MEEKIAILESEIKAIQDENIIENLEKPEKEKKEVQGTIIPVVQVQNGKVSEEDFFSVLKIVSPGTNLRTALDGIIKMGKGAIIAVESTEIIPILDGGFRVNCRFTPQRLMELTKMDGAIILSKDLKRISLANVLLTPDSKIKSSETGTRHKAAERTAKQTSSLVIAVSERKNEINLFYKNLKYHLKSTPDILRRANEHIQLLEKQRELFDKNIEKLNKLELRNNPSLSQAILIIQKGRLIQKISDDLKRYVIELGNEGSLIKTRLKELISGIEKETNLVIKDYTKLDLKKSKILLESLSYDELLDSNNILSVLAYENISPVQVKGWRILSKTSLIESDIAKIIKDSGSLGKAIHSNAHEISPILGDDKTQLFKEEINRIKLNS